MKGISFTLVKAKVFITLSVATLLLVACQTEDSKTPSDIIEETHVENSAPTATHVKLIDQPNCNVPPISGGLYTIVNRATNLALDVYRMEETGGTPLIQWHNVGTPNQTFKVTDVGEGNWKIEAIHSGLSLDVLDIAQHEGARIVQWPYWGGENQQWALVKSSAGGFSVRARHSGLSLTAEDDAINSPIIQAKESGQSSQRWFFNPTNGHCVQPIGFANTPGSDGLTATTGGSTGQSIHVESCEQLATALSSAETLSIYLPDRTLDCRTPARTIQACQINCPSYRDPEKIFYRVPVGSQTCTELGSHTDSTYNQPRYEKRMNVSSNKSIIGLGSHSKLLGVSLNLSNSKNIIVSNFTIDDVNPHLVEAGDGLSVDNASHIWIDHLRTQNISDGHIDIRNSENITLSFNHFDGYNNFVCGSQHHYTMLLQDSQATLHNNYFDRVSGRNPKLVGDSTRAHLFNNYWQDVTYFAISASHGAQALIEKNVFNNSRRPHWNESGYIEAFGNEYTGISATDPERDGENEVFNDVQLYPYILENITEVNINVRQSAGPK